MVQAAYDLLDLGPEAGISLGTLVAFMQYAALLYIPIQEMAARFTETLVPLL